MVSRYVTNGPVKQEGMCIMPPPPPHYRMMPPQRPDTFHVATQPPYVPQPPQNQTGNQGPGIRGMAPTGPPTQSSTPPNTDLKVPMPQQSMNLTYVSQASVRGGQNLFSRGPPPQSQNPRMPNHRQGQQQMFQAQSTQFMVPPMPPVFCTMPYYGANAQRPTTGIMQPYFASQIFQYPQSPQTPQTYMTYPYMQRQGPPPQVASAPQSLSQQQAPTIPLAQSAQPHTMPRAKQRRAKAIPIIDPTTGVDKLKEMYEQDDSHPASGESSARQTPQPPYIPNKEIQNAFNKQVNMVINQDKMEELEHSSLPPLDPHMDNQNIYPTPLQAVHNANRIDLVQSSKLQVPTKEFVPAIQPNTAKESTPVVSANTDAAEVTIPKNNKDRESPAKSRKQREQSTREVTAKDVSITSTEKSNKEEYKGSKDEYKYSKESVSPTPSIPPPTKEIKEISNQREEKKNQKKDKVEQPKLPSSTSNTEPVVENVITAANPSQTLVTQDNGKSKSRSKDGQKQAQQQQQQSVSTGQKAAPPVVPIPQTQPSKPNNKTNKMRELNMKGANKEGTDMDAFNDNNLAPSLDTINVNVNNCNNANSDGFNDNDVSATVNDSNKRNENTTDLPTIKSDIKTSLPKSKIDVTDIVKDVPKPFIAPVESSQDETDRSDVTNDKLIQPKYESNAKPNVENETNIEVKPSLPYKEDQWAPFNLDGKKIYDRDFLLALRNDPKSRKKPDNLLHDVMAQEDRGRIGDISRYPMGVRTTDFVPNFGGSNYSSKSSSQRGVPPKRNSQQGKVGGGSKGKANNVIKLSISVKEDVKLHETENAWKPARFTIGNNMTEDEKKTQELYRKVRGVLNKLTPQKFETLVMQVRSLTIDTSERLQGVIDLVFEKAVDEPNFSVAYALMCRELALMQVPVDSKKKDEFVNFRKLLVTRCQLEFEKNSVDESARNERVKEIEACNDPEKKKELQLLMEEEDRRIRRKSVGNIRFIGELFKQQMLTANIMLRCLNNLLENKDEESLECLCKLLTTVGKEIEAKQHDISSIFTIMKEIVDKKHGKISSRVRFMLQDVIDLRNSKWVPRRQDLNPKTMDQIQKEADTEHLNIQAMNSVPITPRKDDRGNPSSNTDRKRNRNNPSDNDGWTSAPSRSRTAFTVQSDKLKNKPPQIDEPLGNSLMFGNWGRGSNIKTTPAPPPNTGNMYAALENIGNETDRKSGLGSRSTSKDPYHSKGPSLERNYKHMYEDGRGSRSGSQQRSNDNSQRSTPTPVPQQALPKFTNPPPVTKSRPAVDQITPEQLELRLKNILEEYLNDCCTVTECDDDIKTSIPPAAMSQLVSDCYLNVLERSKTARSRTGNLCAQLIKLKTLSIDNYCMGLTDVLSQADDLKIDIPKIWDCLADVIAPVICENTLSLIRLEKCCSDLTSQGHSAKLLAPLFKIIVEEKGPNFLSSIWHESNLSFADFMPASQVNFFINDNQFEFLLDGSNTPSGQSEFTYEQIHNKLIDFFTKNNSFDDIINWITANVGDRVKENQFIRTLATAVFEVSIVNSKLKTEILRDHYNLLIRFVDSNSDYELQCLYALQALSNKLEHPQGILLSICNSLYDDNVFSHDSFVAWETSKDPAEQEGKGVAVKQLTSFFTQLKEADEDSSSSEDT